MKVVVVGGGLSGLFSSYSLVKRGHEVTLFEKSARLGGHIHSLHLPWGLIETAANAVMNSPRIQELSADIGVPLIPMERAFRKRYIFRERPRRMPLSGLEAFRLMAGMLRRVPPAPGENAEQYSLRHFGHGVTKYLIEPAVLGIFGAPLRFLSARLITDYFFNLRSGKVARGERGSVAPANGMQALVIGLEKWLREKGVEFKMSTNYDIDSHGAGDSLIVCTDAHAAADVFAPLNSHLSAQLRHVTYRSLSSVTVASDTPGSLKGFGCLFPLDQKFSAYGVLFNPYIFKNRGPSFTETWIVPNVNPNDDELLNEIKKDRERLFGTCEPFHHSLITRWARALPVYDQVLEKLIHEVDLPPRCHIVSNYWGRLGLTKILDQSAEVADRIGRPA